LKDDVLDGVFCLDEIAGGDVSPFSDDGGGFIEEQYRGGVIFPGIGAVVVEDLFDFLFAFPKSHTFRLGYIDGHESASRFLCQLEGGFRLARSRRAVEETSETAS